MPDTGVLLQGGSVWDGSGQACVRRGRSRSRQSHREGAPDARCATRIVPVRIDIAGHTVIPGLVEGHAHLPFAHKANIADTGDIPPEDHTLLTLLHARIVLEAGFTSCLSGGSAKPRLDIAVRDFINAGHAPGPRLLAASPELTNTGNLGDERRLHLYRESIAMVVDGADEMLRTVRMLIREGVDTIKLNVSGNQTIPNARSHVTVMREDELATAVETAHAHGKRVAAHVRAAASIKLALRHGVDILYHCEYADEECLDLMEAARDRIFVAPAIGLLHALMHEAEPWGITHREGGCHRRGGPVRACAGGVSGAAQARRPGAHRRRLRISRGRRTARTRATSSTSSAFSATPMPRRWPARRARVPAPCCSKARRDSCAKAISPICWWSRANRRTTCACCSRAANIKLVMKDGRLHTNLFAPLH